MQEINLQRFCADCRGDRRSNRVFLPSQSDVKVLYDKLVKAGIPTKNLPDAYDWHFAGTWDHIIPKHTPSWFNDNLDSDKKSSGLTFRSLQICYQEV